jgi:hypothetical protein
MTTFTSTTTHEHVHRMKSSLLAMGIEKLIQAPCGRRGIERSLRRVQYLLRVEIIYRRGLSIIYPEFLPATCAVATVAS